MHLTSCSDLATPQDEKCNRGEKKGEPEHVYILNALANKAALFLTLTSEKGLRSSNMAHFECTVQEGQRSVEHNRCDQWLT